MLSQERVDAEITRRRESIRNWASGAMERLGKVVALLEDDQGTHTVAGFLDEAEYHLDAARRHLAQAEALEMVRHAR